VRRRAYGRGGEDGERRRRAYKSGALAALSFRRRAPQRPLLLAAPFLPSVGYLATFWTVHIGTCLCFFLPAGPYGYTDVYPLSAQPVPICGHDGLRV